MQSRTTSTSLERSRVGIHYFPDTLHYRESDLQKWIPELQALGISWLVLHAPAERAIPEFFLKGCLEAGIEPLLHFDLPVDRPDQHASLSMLFQAYARWGIRYVILFSRPNNRKAWKSSSWAQSDLVERFLDVFLPLAEAALAVGLSPVFPPLEPGGDYWDLAFLRAALRGIGRRSHTSLLQNLLLSAYGGTNGHPLDWGAGGPERWPGARPYYTPPGVQDQAGFHIFDWYRALAQAELGSPKPIILLESGSRYGEAAPSENTEILSVLHAQRNLALVRALAGKDDALGPIGPEVIAANFWLLSTETDSPQAADAWFQANGSTLPIVGALRQWSANKRFSSSTGRVLNQPSEAHFLPSHAKSAAPEPDSNAGHPIQHYLLLPFQDPGGPEWRLDSVRPYLKNSHPTVGFSLEEAALAARVTVVGGVMAYPDEALEGLRVRGCVVDRFMEDGTTLAT